MNVNTQLLIFSTMYFVLQEASNIFVELRHHEKTIRKCSKCPPGWGVVTKCTRHKDTVCGECEFGKSYSAHHSNKSPCWLCSRCGVGLYEAHSCSLVRDTICNECTAYIGSKNFTRSEDFNEKCAYMFIKNSRTHRGRNKSETEFT